MVGRTISHYKVLTKLGEDGIGVLCETEDTKLKRPVGLKFLPPTCSVTVTSEPGLRGKLKQQPLCSIRASVVYMRSTRSKGKVLVKSPRAHPNATDQAAFSVRSKNPRGHMI